LEERTVREKGKSRNTFKTHGIGINFEGVRALDRVDLLLNRREILGLIGPNGAGKTTMVNVMTGALPASFGRVELEGKDVTGWPPNRIARKGVGRTFQNVRLFKTLTVLENVEMGSVGVGMSWKDARRKAWELLDWMHLGDVAGAQANMLPYGQDRQLGILRALASNPAFLLLDEPGAGLDESESNELLNNIIEIRDKFGCGVMVIEHDMRLIMRLCDRIHVLDYGKTISVGKPAEVCSDPAVIKAYLGTEDK